MTRNKQGFGNRIASGYVRKWRRVMPDLTDKEMKTLLRAQQGELDAVLMYNALAQKAKIPVIGIPSGSWPRKKGVMPRFFMH